MNEPWRQGLASHGATALVLALAAWWIVVGARSIGLLVASLRRLADAAETHPQAPSLLLSVAVLAACLAAAGAWRRVGTRRASAILGAGALGVSFVAALAARAGADFLWLIVTALCAQQLGDWTLSLLRFRRLATVDRLLLAQGLGWGTLSLLALAVGVAGWLRAPLVAALLVAPALVFGVLQTRRWRRSTSHEEARRRGPATAAVVVPLALAAAGVLMAYTRALAPEVETDAVGAHLGLARVWVDEHSVQAVASRSYSLTRPLAAQAVYAFALSVASPALAKLIHFWMGLVALACAARLAWRQGGARAAALAAALLATAPLVLWEMGTAFVDLFALVFVLVAVLCLAGWAEEGDWRWMALAALALGFGMSTKQSVAFVAAGVGMAVVGVGARSRGANRRWRAALWLALGAAAAAGPWLWWNAHASGSGRIQGVDTLLIALRRGPTDDLRRLGNLPGFGLGRELVNLPTLPWDLTFQGERFIELGEGNLGVAGLLLLPMLAFVPRRREVAQQLVVLAVALVFWFYTAQYLRYLLPALALVAVLAASGCSRFAAASAARSGSRRTAAFALWGALLAGLPLFLARLAVFPGGLPVELLAGGESRGAYLDRILPIVPALRQLDLQAARGDTIVALPHAPQLYTHTRPLDWPWARGWLAQPASPTALLERFAAERVRHLVIDRNSLPIEWSERMITQRSFLEERARLLYADRGVYLYALDKLPPPRGPELLRNPGFEQLDATGTPAEWTRYGSPRLTAAADSIRPHGGRVAVRATTRDSLVQPLEARAGTRYILAHHWRCERPEGRPRLQVNWLDDAGTLLGASIEVAPENPAPKYNDSTMAATAPAGTTHAWVYVSTHEESACWFDDYSFRQAAVESSPP